MTDPIASARASMVRGPCTVWVVEWLQSTGATAPAPTIRDMIRDWRSLGVEGACRKWCARLGLTPCASTVGCVALVAQDGKAPILGVMAEDDLFIARSFSRILICRDPQIIEAWHV